MSAAGVRGPVSPCPRCVGGHACRAPRLRQTFITSHARAPRSARRALGAHMSRPRLSMRTRSVPVNGSANMRPDPPSLNPQTPRFRLLPCPAEAVDDRQSVRPTSQRAPSQTGCAECGETLELVREPSRRYYVVREPLWCSECGELLEGRQAVVCSRRCKDARYRRLHPEEYAARSVGRASVGGRREVQR